jgi:hypothetical protein
MRGDYIAFCEGDDFWCDKGKLQMQFDFLENNEEYNCCFHTTKVAYEGFWGGSSYMPNRDERKRILDKDGDLSIGDLLGCYMAHTSSFMGRWPYRRSLPDDWSNLKGLDIFLMLIIAAERKIKYLDQVMSVYRRTRGNHTNLQNISKMAFFGTRGKYWVVWYGEMDKYSGGKYHKEIMKRLNFALKYETLFHIKMRKFNELRLLFFQYYTYFFDDVNIARIFGLKSRITALLCEACLNRSKDKIVAAAAKKIKHCYYMGLLFDEIIEL